MASHVSSIPPQSKRQRQESSSHFQHDDHEDTNSKRPKPLLVQNILSVLDLDQEDDPQDPTQHDLSAIYTTLHREISSDDFDFLPDDPPPPLTTTGTDVGVESVIRHLLEASDDELGIPSTDDQVSVPVAFTDYGLWEFEDETANYYTFLQSQLSEGLETEYSIS